MDLKILVVYDGGNQQHERVVLQAVNSCNLANYMLADTTFTDSTGRVSNKLRHVFWGQNLFLTAGDAVVVYTGRGNYNKTRLSTGAVMHFLYWGLDRPVWNNTGDAAVLIHTPTFEVARTR